MTLHPNSKFDYFREDAPVNRVTNCYLCIDHLHHFNYVPFDIFDLPKVMN